MRNTILEHLAREVPRRIRLVRPRNLAEQKKLAMQKKLACQTEKAHRAQLEETRREAKQQQWDQDKRHYKEGCTKTPTSLIKAECCEAERCHQDPS
jgi:hypothetical protein